MTIGEELQKKEMAEAAYERGAIAFSKGRYQDTLDELSRCLKIEKDCDSRELEVEANNMLGMLFYFTGYNTIALDHYLSAYESAKLHENNSGQIASLLNIGLLYQAESEFDKAMSYYRKAKEIVESDVRNMNMSLNLYANIQIALLLCKQGELEEAVALHHEIEKYYKAVGTGFMLQKTVLDIYILEYQGQKEQVEKNISDVFHFLEIDDEFMEQVDFYIELCEFFFKNGHREKGADLLKILQEKMQSTEFYFVRVRMAELNMENKKKCGTGAEYIQACEDYMLLYQEYEQTLKKFRKHNLDNMESLHKLEAKRKEMEKRSNCDLATGLLNKKAFQYEVEAYLTERAGYVIDAMAFIDIDDFKLVNDSFGHLFGDGVLVTVAERIREHFDKNTICGRFGGDEFVVFIKDVKDLGILEERIEMFREEFSKIGFGKNKDFYATISVGVSYNQGLKVSYQAMISCADEALEKAKEYGKNRVALYEIKRGMFKHGKKK